MANVERTSVPAFVSSRANSFRCCYFFCLLCMLIRSSNYFCMLLGCVFIFLIFFSFFSMTFSVFYQFLISFSVRMEYKHQFKIISKSKKEEENDENVSFMHWSYDWLNALTFLYIHTYIHILCVCIRIAFITNWTWNMIVQANHNAPNSTVWNEHEDQKRAKIKCIGICWLV